MIDFKVLWKPTPFKWLDMLRLFHIIFFKSSLLFRASKSSFFVVTMGGFFYEVLIIITISWICLLWTLNVETVFLMAQIFMNFMWDPNSYIRIYIYIGLNAWRCKHCTLFKLLTQNLLTKHGTIRVFYVVVVHNSRNRYCLFTNFSTILNLFKILKIKTYLK